MLESLVRQAQSGDNHAYDDIYHHLQPDIRRFVRRLLGGDHDAIDDIVQDTFLRAYVHLATINPPAKFRPYLYRIARNCTYDVLRQHQRRPQISLDDEPLRVQISFNEARHQVHPDDTAHWLLLHLEVREAIDQLPPSQREALILYSEEQMSYAEIAAAMECHVGTVKSRLYHAKRNLRAYLSPATLALLEDEFQPLSHPKSSPTAQTDDVSQPITPQTTIEE